MHPDGITSSVQTGPLAPRLQGVSMNRKLLVVLLLALLIASSATFIVFHLLYSGSHHPNYLREAVLVIAFLFVFAGSEKLKRAGYRKYPMYHILCSFMFITALAVLPLPKSARHIVLEYGLYLFYALIAGMLPLSFYLDHKQKKSSTESTIADAN
jgi:O-antigen/teichoic acid export membrane protein